VDDPVEKILDEVVEEAVVGFPTWPMAENLLLLEGDEEALSIVGILRLVLEDEEILRKLVEDEEILQKLVEDEEIF
jgi:hypothetical protein